MKIKTRPLDFRRENDVQFPAAWEQIADLTPFGAEYRYGRLLAEINESEPFDRQWALSIIRQNAPMDREACPTPSRIIAVFSIAFGGGVDYSPFVGGIMAMQF